MFSYWRYWMTRRHLRKKVVGLSPEDGLTKATQISPIIIFFLFFAVSLVSDAERGREIDGCDMHGCTCLCLVSLLYQFI